MINTLIFNFRLFGLIAAALVLTSFSASAQNDASTKFKSWFRKYKNAEIELYQPSPMPIRIAGKETYQYFIRDNQKKMDALLDGLTDQNDLRAVRLLVEAASFRFDRNADAEAKNHFKKQPWTLRAHALEALGKITDPESMEWLRARCLGSESGWDAPFRRVIAASVFGLGQNQDGVVLLKSMLDDPDLRVVTKAIAGLGRIGGTDELDIILEKLGDKSPHVRVAALDAIGGILSNTRNSVPSLAEKVLFALFRHLDDPEWSVQDAVLSLMESYRSTKSIPVLIVFLEKCSPGRQANRERTLQRAASVLRSLTGARINNANPGKWAEWWSENRAAFELAPAPPSKLLDFQLDSPGFFNIPVNSDCVCFTLDISGSMRSPLTSKAQNSGAESESKLVYAREELLKTLCSLDPEVRFNVILFNDVFRSLFKNPAPACEENIRKAKAFFEAAEADGGTDVFGALHAALNITSMGLVNSLGNDTQIDTLFLLSDGVSTTGTVIDPDEILRIITKANRLSKIRINTVFLGTSPDTFMHNIAKNNFGRCVHIK